MGKAVCTQKTVELGQRESKHLTKPRRGGTRKCSYKMPPKQETKGEGHRWNTPGRFKRNLRKKETNLQMNRKLRKKVAIIK